MFEHFIILYTLHPHATTLCMGIFFLMVGSLLNVFIYRLPIMLYAQWNILCREHLHLEPIEQEKINLFFPRSHCTHCGHTIRAIENIPLLSFILLRGRCAHCHTKISYQYPLVEIATMLLSLAAVYHFGLGLPLLFALVFIWILIVLFVIDLRHQLLPDELTQSLLWLGLLANITALFCPLSSAVIGALCGYLSLWLFIKLFYLITGKIGMGNGDFKLFAAFGAWFGPLSLPMMIMLASMAGAIIGIAYLKITRKNKDTPIPFGPFLCLAGLVALFYGDALLTWYPSGLF